MSASTTDSASSFSARNRARCMPMKPVPPNITTRYRREDDASFTGGAYRTSVVADTGIAHATQLRFGRTTEMQQNTPDLWDQLWQRGSSSEGDRIALVEERQGARWQRIEAFVKRTFDSFEGL